MARPIKHGHTSGGKTSRTYFAWASMKKRCRGKNDKYYHRYGGRGISVCERWLEFSNFLQDMGEVPEGLSLDRYPDNDGNYEPGNCRWATQKEQVRNTSQNNMITFNGETMCRTDWEVRLGISSGALWHRLKNGWSLEEALTIRNMNP